MEVTFFVSPVIRSEFSCDEDLGTFLQEVPGNSLSVFIELLFVDNAVKEDRIVATRKVVCYTESCECLLLVGGHVCCESSRHLDEVVCSVHKA